MVFLILSLAAASEPTSAVVDRVVVVVGERIITDSDIRLEAELNRKTPSPILALRLRAADTQQLLIERAVIRGLAGQINLYQPTDTELQQRLDDVRQSFGTPEQFQAFLDRHGLTEDALAARLLGQLIVERYVYRNVDLASQTAKEDEARYYDRYLKWIRRALSQTAIRVVPRQ
ncbi:MAG: hypothetical protein AAFV53_29085 [Myxococcota bacterium]